MLHVFMSEIWSRLCVNLTRLLDHIGDSTGPVLPVFKGDLCLARSLNSDGETSSSGFSGPDTELSWKTTNTFILKKLCYIINFTGTIFTPNVKTIIKLHRKELRVTQREKTDKIVDDEDFFFNLIFPAHLGSLPLLGPVLFLLLGLCGPLLLPGVPRWTGRGSQGHAGLYISHWQYEVPSPEGWSGHCRCFLLL